jgi:DNA-binding CsgD family transcriptional regulator
MAGKKQPTLTEGQKDCLRLVDQLLTSKEIARRLQISPFTVDQRLDAARRKLGATTRKEAARIFANQESSQLSEAFVYEAEPVANLENSATMNWSNEGDGGNFESANRGTNRWILYKGLGDEQGSLRVTMPMLGADQHDLSRTEVASAIIKTALFSILSVSAIVMIVVGLMRLLG